MSAFSRFLNRFWAAPETAVRRDWKREKARARLLSRRLADATETVERQQRELSDASRREEALELDLAGVRQELAQKVGYCEVMETQVALMTTIVAKHQAIQEAEATIQGVRKGLAADKLIRQAD